MHHSLITQPDVNETEMIRELPSHEEMAVRLKAWRVTIDHCIKEGQCIAHDLARGNAGREVALSITKLQEGKMWAGQALGELGHKLPEAYRDEAEI
jgi:hypothetical protein